VEGAIDEIEGAGDLVREVIEVVVDADGERTRRVVDVVLLVVAVELDTVDSAGERLRGVGAGVLGEP
jgi:hypothetical protein